MKVKHFGRFFITEEGVGLLDVDMDAREVAKKEASRAEVASKVPKDSSVTAIGDAAKRPFTGEGKRIRASADGSIAISGTVTQEQRRVTLESSLAFLKVSKKAANRMAPERRPYVMDEIHRLETEAETLVETQEVGVILAFSKRVGALGREILALSNL